MTLDRVPGHANLYIGGLFTLKRREALKTANITHVLSVLTLPLDDALFDGYKHLVIDLDDVEEADILQHFPASNAFINDGLQGGGGVLVHCAMGKSRSATLVIAHHLSTHPTSSDPASALMLLRQARPMAEPNPGFMDQLHLYHRMRCPADIASHPLYQRWCYKREVQRSRERKEAVSSEFIVFEDEAAAAPAGEMSSPSSSLEKPRWDIAEGRSQGQDGGNDEGKQEDTSGEKEGGGEEEEEYRCRRCRTQLGRSGYRIPHTPPRGNKANNHNPQCAHLFLQPLSWMREVLSQGNLEGRLECPNVRCRQNVGKYGWQGMKCSCGEWVVPGISLGRGKVDVVVVRKRDGGGG